MNFEWLLLAFFLVAIIIGVKKALKRDMLKNLLRLGTVVIAFFIAFFMQLGGVFQGIVSSIAKATGFSEAFADAAIAEPILLAVVSTIGSTVLFVLVFLLVLMLLRIVLHFVLKAVMRKKKAERTADAVKTDAEKATPAEADAEKSAEAEPVDAVAESSAEEAPADAVAENSTEESASAVKTARSKKPLFYQEIAWKRAVSISSGVLAGVLILGILLLPVFYLMSLVTTVTSATDGLDANDSQVYKAVAVADFYIAEPYEESFVVDFYDTLGISDLMTYTAKLGGKTELDTGDAVYVDDSLKTALSRGVSVLAQISSEKSQCLNVREDVNAIVSDPLILSFLPDLLCGYLHDMELEKPADNNLTGGVLYNFLMYYKEAEKDTIQKEMAVLDDVIGGLAETRILAPVLSGKADFEKMLEDRETLGNVVQAISPLSAFGPTLEGTFELGVDVMCDTLQIPENDAEAYDIFMEDLLTQMQKSSNVKFDINAIRYYIVKCEQTGKKTVASNGISGHSQFIAYAEHWAKVQSAFAHAAEDESYGYFTIEINGQLYIYDKNERCIVIYNEETEEAYKDKLSPLAGIINALTLRSTEKRLTRDNVYSILNAYVASANDAKSIEVANRILAKENFVSQAVTAEKMLAATDFTDWTTEEKEKDSKLCVEIVMEILTLMDHLSSLDSLDGIEEAVEMLDEFTLLGQTMDMMKQTSCINNLPPLLLEGVVKNEAFEDFMKPSVAYQINSIVEKREKTYEDSMIQIAGILRWAVHSFGNAIGG